MDRERIVNLLELLKSSSAQELAVREGDSYIRLRRAGVAAAAPAAVPSGDGPAPVAVAPAPVAAPATVPVTARLVGFFHPGKGPDSEPLVRVGDRVRQGQTIATIESLRQMTAVMAPVAGVVQEVVAEAGQPVQFGDVLILLEPTEG